LGRIPLALAGRALMDSPACEVCTGDWVVCPECHQPMKGTMALSGESLRECTRPRRDADRAERKPQRCNTWVHIRVLGKGRVVACVVAGEELERLKAKARPGRRQLRMPPGIFPPRAPQTIDPAGD
jgi:hypothetical protein